MLFKIAWRNIGRNKLRSLVVITALALGLWAGTFASAFVNGMMNARITKVISEETAHIQIHHKAFRDEFLVSQVIPEADSVSRQWRREPLVKAIAMRTQLTAMLGTSKGNAAVKLSGINPDEESQVARLDAKVKEGEYFPQGKKHPILISKLLAEKYQLGLKSKIVLTFQAANGEITAGAFRVAGIFDSGNRMFDLMNVFVLGSDLRELSGAGIHEIAILLKEHEPADSLTSQIQSRYPQLEVLCWKDLSGGMRYIIEVMDYYTLIIVGIILLALLFSIVNTMLMAVLERVREIGMLMALGLNRTKIFLMVLLETLFLSLIGGPAGLFLAWTSITFFGNSGIDLGNAAYENWGYSNLIFPELAGIEYVKITAMVIGMAFIASLYPARTALRLKPIDAMRKI